MTAILTDSATQVAPTIDDSSKTNSDSFPKSPAEFELKNDEPNILATLPNGKKNILLFCFVSPLPRSY